MPVSVKAGGAWKSLNKAFVKVGGAWKEAQVYVKAGGVWKRASATSRTITNDQGLNLVASIEVYANGVFVGALTPGSAGVTVYDGDSVVLKAQAQSAYISELILKLTNGVLLTSTYSAYTNDLLTTPPVVITGDTIARLEMYA